MSGHSRWSNIKHRKEKGDAQKAKIFTKISREIIVAVREGGADPNSNSRLRDMIAKARANNIPSDNINRLIKKITGGEESENYEAVIYEGYGPGGIAVMVEALTDNKNRTASELRHIFERNGGSLGTPGCVSYMFDRKGVIILNKIKPGNEDEEMMTILDAGAEDINDDGDVFEVICDPANIHGVKEALEKSGFKVESAEAEWIPVTTVTPDAEAEEKFRRIMEMLDDSDDVNEFYHNADIEEEE